MGARSSCHEAARAHSGHYGKIRPVPTAKQGLGEAGTATLPTSHVRSQAAPHSSTWQAWGGRGPLPLSHLVHPQADSPAFPQALSPESSTPFSVENHTWEANTRKLRVLGAVAAWRAEQERSVPSRGWTSLMPVLPPASEVPGTARCPLDPREKGHGWTK